MKGHLDLNAQFKFKDGDGPRFALYAETTEKFALPRMAVFGVRMR